MATLTDELAAEYRVLKQGCGLIDRSERGKLALTGTERKSFLAGQVTNDIEGLTPGSGCYAAFLTHKGKMLGDLRVLDVDDGDGEAELLLDTERGTLQALFDLVRRFKIGYDVDLHKRTVQRGLLSLIGPEARAIAGAEAVPVDEHAHRPGEVDGHPVRLIATDLGIDVLCDADATADVRGALITAGAIPVSEDGAEILRVESGRPRYGFDVDDSTIPQEAGLNDRAVSFTKGCYVGQETVARLFYRGKPNRHLRGLKLSEPVPAGAELRLGERVVGTVRSSLVSPTLGPIALALVRREAVVGDTLDVAGGASAFDKQSHRLVSLDGACLDVIQGSLPPQGRHGQRRDRDDVLGAQAQRPLARADAGVDEQAPAVLLDQSAGVAVAEPRRDRPLAQDGDVELTGVGVATGAILLGLWLIRQ
ncbi:MAG: folate-binding protein [Actinobacteria bacterium]|nr:folate-binding protein [Actinomycetota bacterium]